MRVLLVDDEEGIRKVLSISLADSGYQVWAAQSGEEALRRWMDGLKKTASIATNQTLMR